MEDASCVAASCRMAANLHDMPEMWVRGVLGTDNGGSYLSAVPQGLKELGFAGSASYIPKAATVSSIESLTRNGARVIVNVRTEAGSIHALVVTKVENGQAFILDPWPIGVGSAYTVPSSALQSVMTGAAVSIKP